MAAEATFLFTPLDLKSSTRLVEGMHTDVCFLFAHSRFKASVPMRAL